MYIKFAVCLYTKRIYPYCIKTGLPASPRMPHVTVKESVAFVALRTDITGIVSNNVTLIFEVEATSSNTSEVLIRNFTITGYISSSDVSVPFDGLREGHYYRFRSRVFNIYGGSQYSLTSAGTLIGEHMHVLYAMCKIEGQLKYVA